MHIIGVQFDILWENRQGNFDKVDSLLAKEDVPAGSLVVLPEMFASGWSGFTK
jgi:omega-amidase